MFSRPFDLPLDQDGSSRFLPWIIALMVYLAALSLAVAMAIGATAGRWDQGFSGTMTVQIVPDISAGNSDKKRQAKTAKALDLALTLLRDTPGVISAESLSVEEISSLLAPWLGEGSQMDELEIPRLIDVRVDPETGPDLATVKRRLAGVSGVVVDDHGIWLERLVKLAYSVEVIAFAIVLCIALAAVATVVFTTRSGMAVHHGTIEVMHLIGAQDVYIARQFQFHAMLRGLRGSLAGLAMAAVTLAVLGTLAGSIDLPLFPALTLTPWQWAGLAIMPVAAALITMITARITVLRALVEMP